MTLEKTLRHKLAEAQLDSGPQQVSLADADSGWTISCLLHRHDELSCLLGEIHLQGPGSPGGRLRAWADRIAARVGGLLQPLNVLEIDDQRNQGILRSADLTEIA